MKVSQPIELSSVLGFLKQFSHVLGSALEPRAFRSGKFVSDKFHALVWPEIIRWRDNPKPDDPAWVEFRRDARDGVSIFGRCLRAGDGARGTLIFVHGFTTNGGVFRDLAYQFRDRLGMNVITPDLRHHGLSGDRPPTFGTAESWDVAACLDWAEENGMPRPFSVVGESLGGMTTQRLLVEDPRVDNAVCIHPPGWPWDAIGKCVTWGVDGFPANIPFPVRALLSPFRDRPVGIGNVINEAYGFDILNDGDPRSHAAHPPGSPRILYLIGEDDPYGPENARQVWRHFYPSEPAVEGVWPADAPNQKKYFITVPAFRHFPPGPTVFEWGDFWPLVESFL